MNYNYRKLSGRIVEILGSQFQLARALELSERSISLKMTGKREWKQREMAKICEVLEIPPEQIHEYFFNYEVQKN